MSDSIIPVPEMWGDHASITRARYAALYRQSVEEPEVFWAHEAEAFHWFKSWSRVKTGAFIAPVSIRWFEGATTNLSYNCLDRHLAKFKDRTAIIWEADTPGQSRTLSYGQLHAQVCRAANALKNLGVKKGDRVTIYLPMIPEASVAMLACARIGAIHSVVFGGFSAEALRGRIEDCGSTVVITADGGNRGGKKQVMKANVDAAVAGTSVQNVLVVRHTGQEVAWDAARDVWWSEALEKAAPECASEQMDAEDPLFILYTSGSTGKPKGLVHTTGGYMVWAGMTFRTTFDYRAPNPSTRREEVRRGAQHEPSERESPHPNPSPEGEGVQENKGDVFWCTADIGWVTGHSYTLYGPLLNGATTLMFEGVPNYPDASRCWEVIDRHGVTIFYTAPTAIRALMREGDKFVARTSRKTLRLLGSVGEPINPEAWLWYWRVVGEGRVPVIDTWWQTETGGHMITPFPAATPMKPGAASWPHFGVVPVIVDQEGKELEGACEGLLCIREAWPGIARTIWGNHERYEQGYFGSYTGLYFTGDGAKRDADGYYWITGRVDDVLNVSGHRLGTAEIESALVAHFAVAEAAVVGYPHDVKGQGVYAYVTLKQGVEPGAALEAELRAQVAKHLSPIAKPDVIHFTPELPKTRSGKIMRRILRKIAEGDVSNLGDVSTLTNPGIVGELVGGRKV